MFTFLLQSSACLILLYGIYHFILAEMTFFRHNRVYLLWAIAVSLLIPILAPYIIIPREAVPAVHWSYVSTGVNKWMIQDVEKTNYLQIFLWVIYVLGVGLILFKMGLGLTRIYKYHVSGLKEQKTGYTLVTTDAVHLPFSFFKSVYISKHIPLNDHIHTILDHEEIHIRQRHTVDVLFAEVVHAFFWFNPVMIFYKRALRQAHEYLADEAICCKSSVGSYAELLLSKSQSGLELALTNQFFHSQIKKRIQMMTSNKTETQTLWKYVIVIPIFLGLIVFFSSSAVRTDFKNALTNQKDTIPPSKPSISDLKSDVLPTKVKSIHIKDAKVEVKLKSGKTEVYNLKNIKDKALFEAKYGDLPSAPPPPPPPSAMQAPAPPQPPAPPAAKSQTSKISAPDFQAPPPPPAPKSPMDFTNPPNAPAPPPPPNGIKLVMDGEDPLFVIDGIKKTRAELDKVNPDDIQTVDVLKGTSASALYGDEGKNGVIQIITKKNSGRMSNDKTTSSIIEDVFNEVEEMPRFPGCESISNENERDICAQNKLMDYIYRNHKYPSDARQKGIEGNCVAEFIIDKKGYITELKLIRDIGSGCGEELIRVITSMNQMKERWIPARQNGNIVNVKYTLPVKFAI